MSAEAFAFENRLNQGARVGSSRPWTVTEVAAALANAAIAIAIVLAFYNRFWWAPDDGTYAYIADRILGGAVLNRDVQDIHGGYVHFLNAFALDVFGRDFVSLRYPLAFLTVVQSCIVFLLLRPLIGAAAIAGGVAMAALTFVQFLNPTPNWYALFLTVLVITMLATRVQRSPLGIAAVGFLIATIVLFRQLSGVLVGMGAVAYLLLGESGPDEKRGEKPAAAWAIAAAMTMALAAYLWLKTDPVAFAPYGFFPLAVLIAVGVRTRLGNRAAMEMVAALLAGGAVAVLPLFLYHLSHGSLGAWWEDTVVAAVSLSELDFFRQASYALPLTLAAKGVASLSDPVAVLNGGFWLLVFLAPLVLGFGVARALWRNERELHPLPFVALFYALVSAHYAIPIYALYPAGLTFAGLLVVAPARIPRATAVAATLFAVAIGLGFQAAQPLSRGLDGIIRGERVALDADGLPGAHLRIEKQDQAVYRDLLAFIEAYAAPGDTILGLPMTPELYFLSERSPPVRFAIAPLGLLSDRDVEETWRRVAAAMPAVIVFRPDDKYTTRRVRQLMDLLESSYHKCETIGPFQLYAPICRT
jgi:hypothetical protein